MVWQKDKVQFVEFFVLFVPSLLNWLVPASIMHFAAPRSTPPAQVDRVNLKPGARGVIILFALTIATAVSFRNFLGLQPALGMMLGLGYLQVWSYVLQLRGRRRKDDDMVLNSFHQIARVEWDTLLFFFGIIFAVGGLGVLGYLALASSFLYGEIGPTFANVAIGVLSAIVDNIPLMFAVLTMDPDMSHGQWLLITLTWGPPCSRRANTSVKLWGSWDRLGGCTTAAKLEASMFAWGMSRSILPVMERVTEPNRPMIISSGRQPATSSAWPSLTMRAAWARRPIS